MIRADNPAEFCAAMDRIRALLQSPDIRRTREDQERVHSDRDLTSRAGNLRSKGIVTDGELHTLAIFDKPDPLEGPFFEETFYVTPSRAPRGVQTSLFDATRRGRSGPRPDARPDSRRDAPQRRRRLAAGDRCAARLAAFAPALCASSSGIALEELILRHALGEDISHLHREKTLASGVMMIPIPASGIYVGVSGVEDARRPRCLDSSSPRSPGKRCLQLPEGCELSGVYFRASGDARAGGAGPAGSAHAGLRFDIATELPVAPVLVLAFRRQISRREAEPSPKKYCSI